MRSISFTLCMLIFWCASAWADMSWWLGPYDRKDRPGRIGRVCGMDRYTPTIYAEGGAWVEIEVLGNKCLIKLRSSAGTIAMIAADNDFQRLPKDALHTSLSDLTNQQKTRLRNIVTGLGYSLAELQARFPNDLGTYTLADVLRFIASRRKLARYDQPTDAIVTDGTDVPGLDLDAVEGGVQ